MKYLDYGTYQTSKKLGLIKDGKVWMTSGWQAISTSNLKQLEAIEKVVADFIEQIDLIGEKYRQEVYDFTVCYQSKTRREETQRAIAGVDTPTIERDTNGLIQARECRIEEDGFNDSFGIGRE